MGHIRFPDIGGRLGAWLCKMTGLQALPSGPLPPPWLTLSPCLHDAQGEGMGDRQAGTRSQPEVPRTHRFLPSPWPAWPLPV